MSRDLPEIVKQAERVLASIEDAASRFVRRHRYTYGSDLRQCAMRVALLTQQAWRQPQKRAQHIEGLVLAVDELKLRLQLGDSIKAFSSFRSFEHILKLVQNLGRQVGGWQKKHPKGQSAATDSAQQRAPILSTRTAHEASQ